MHDESSAPAEVRISTLVGDRLCISCGYNLVGQPILRESHYDMLIVRCPECATVASVQEYPLLGRWAGRWAAVLAALYLLVLIALWIGSAAAIFGFALGSAEVATDTYSNLIYERFSQWQIQQTSTTTATPTGTTVVIRPGNVDFGAWWAQQDTSQLLRDAGGLFGGMNWLMWYLWMWLTIVCGVFGVMWAVLLFNRSRAGLLLFGLMIVTLAGVIALIPMMEWLSRDPTWGRQAASRQVGPVFLALSLAWAAIALSVFLMMGRSIGRALVRLLLPPRMRSSLAFLWLTDGLEPPTT